MKITAKKLDKIREKLYQVQLQLRKEGGVRNEMCLHRLHLADDTIARAQKILLQKF